MSRNYGKHLLIAAGLTAGLFLTFGVVGESVHGVVSNDNKEEENERNQIVELTLEEARERMVEENREIKRLELGKEKTEIQKNKVERDLDNLKEDRDDLEEDIEDYRDERDDLESKQEDLAEELIIEYGYTNEDLEEYMEAVMKDENDPEDILEEEDIDDDERETLGEFLKNFDRLMEIEGNLFQDRAKRRELREGIINTEEGLREIEQQLEIMEMEYTQLKEQFKYISDTSYVGLLNLDNQLDTMEDVLANMENMLEEEKMKKKVGESTQLAVDMIEKEKMEIENNLETLQEFYRNTERSYLDQLGYSVEVRLDLNDSVTFDIEEFREDYNFDEAMEKALDEGHHMELARKKVEFAEDNVDWAEEHHYFSEQPDLKKIDLEEAKLDKDEARQEMKITMYETKDAFDEAVRDYELAQKEYAINRELLRGEELQKELGMSTSRQVAEAITEKNQAQREMLMKEHDAYLLAQELKLLEEGFMTEMPGMANGEPDNGEAMDGGIDNGSGLNGERGMDDNMEMEQQQQPEG